MASFSLGQIIDAKRMISPNENNGTGAIESETIDLQGAESVAIITAVGTVSTTALDIKYYEMATSPVTVAEGNLIADKNIVEERPSLTAGDNRVYVTTLRPTKRYVRAVVPDRSSEAIHISMVGVLGHLAENPATE